MNKQKITEEVLDKMIKENHEVVALEETIKRAISLAISETEKALFSVDFSKNLIVMEKADWEFDLERAKLKGRQATIKEIFDEIEKKFQISNLEPEDFAIATRIFDDKAIVIDGPDWQQLKKEGEEK